VKKDRLIIIKEMVEINYFFFLSFIRSAKKYMGWKRKRIDILKSLVIINEYTFLR